MFTHSTLVDGIIIAPLVHYCFKSDPVNSTSFPYKLCPPSASTSAHLVIIVCYCTLLMQHCVLYWLVLETNWLFSTHSNGLFTHNCVRHAGFTLMLIVQWFQILDFCWIGDFLSQCAENTGLMWQD